PIFRRCRAASVRRIAIGEMVDELPAVGKPRLRVLRERPRNGGTISRRKGRKIGRTVEMLRRELCGGAAPERRRCGQQALVNNREAVLVAAPAGAAFKEFGRRIQRGEAADNRLLRVADVFDQPEIRNLGMSPLEQEIAGLDVEMLQAV